MATTVRKPHQQFYVFFSLVKMRWSAKWSEAHNLHIHTIFSIFEKQNTHVSGNGGGGGVVDIIIYGVFKVKRKAFCSSNSTHCVRYRRFVWNCVCKVLLYRLYLSLFSALPQWTADICFCRHRMNCLQCVQMSSLTHTHLVLSNKIGSKILIYSKK